MAILHARPGDLPGKGAWVRVRVSAKAGSNTGAAPRAVWILALVDTGARGTVLATSVVERLALRPVGRRSVDTPGAHRVEWPLYEVRLSLPDGTVHDLEVVGIPLENQQPVEALLGRDVLGTAVLVYNGPARQFTLAW